MIVRQSEDGGKVQPCRRARSAALAAAWPTRRARARSLALPHSPPPRVCRSVCSPLCSPSSTSVASNAGYCTTTSSPLALLARRRRRHRHRLTETETRHVHDRQAEHCRRRCRLGLSGARALARRHSVPAPASTLTRRHGGGSSPARFRRVRSSASSTSYFTLQSCVRCGGRFNHFTPFSACATTRTRLLSLSHHPSPCPIWHPLEPQADADGQRPQHTSSSSSSSLSLPLSFSRTSEAGGGPSLERPISQNRYEDGRGRGRGREG